MGIKRNPDTFSIDVEFDGRESNLSDILKSQISRIKDKDGNIIVENRDIKIRIENLSGVLKYNFSVSENTSHIDIDVSPILDSSFEIVFVIAYQNGLKIKQRYVSFNNITREISLNGNFNIGDKIDLLIFVALL